MNKNEPVHIKVLFFSVLKEAIREPMVDLSFPGPLTGEELLDQLSARFQEVARLRPVIRLAVNKAYTPQSVELKGGEEVALITPVSGG